MDPRPAPEGLAKNTRRHHQARRRVRSLRGLRRDQAKAKLTRAKHANEPRSEKSLSEGDADTREARERTAQREVLSAWLLGFLGESPSGEEARRAFTRRPRYCARVERAERRRLALAQERAARPAET